MDDRYWRMKWWYWISTLSILLMISIDSFTIPNWNCWWGYCKLLFWTLLIHYFIQTILCLAKGFTRFVVYITLYDCLKGSVCTPGICTVEQKSNFFNSSNDMKVKQRMKDFVKYVWYGTISCHIHTGNIQQPNNPSNVPCPIVRSNVYLGFHGSGKQTLKTNLSTDQNPSFQLFSKQVQKWEGNVTKREKINRIVWGNSFSLLNFLKGEK